jgi:hypothetical protein
MFVMTAGACSGSSGRGAGPAALTPADAAAALRTAAPLHLEGSVRYVAGNGDDLRKEFAGDVSYSPDRMLAELPIPVGDQLPVVEYRRVEGESWFGRVESSTGTGVGLGIMVYLPEGSTQPYIPLRRFGFVRPYVQPFDPVELLEVLDDEKVEFSKKGAEAVDGTERAHFEAELPEAGIPGLRTVDLFVDEDGVPVLVRFADSENAQYEYRIETGATMPEVDPPLAAEIFDVVGVAPAPTGEYVEITSGTVGASAYEVWRAPSERGWECWKVVSEPPYESLEDLDADGGVCRGGIDKASDDPNLMFDLPVDSIGASPFDMLGLVLPAGSEMTVTYADGDGATQPVEPIALPDADEALYLYAGPIDRVVGFASYTLPDGQEMWCAPGKVNTLRDLRKLDEDEYPTLHDFGWNCLEKEQADLLD